MTFHPKKKRGYGHVTVF